MGIGSLVNQNGGTFAQTSGAASTDVGIAGRTLFTAPGTSLPRGYLTTGISVGMQPVKNLMVSLGYDALINTTHASA